MLCPCKYLSYLLQISGMDLLLFSVNTCNCDIKALKMHFLFFQMSSSVSSVTSPRACCENGRPIMTDPHTGQTVCSCQYGTALLNYSRVQGLPEGIYGASAAAYAVGATQGYVPLGAEGSAFYSPLVSTCIIQLCSFVLFRVAHPL